MKNLMTLIIALGAVTMFVLLFGCTPSQTCATHTDEASCTSDTSGACHWNKNENACKA